MNRRTFNRAALLGIAGALVVGRTGWIGCGAPIVQAETYWKRPPKFSGFRVAEDQDLWYGYLTAERSDGTYFYVTLAVLGDTFAACHTPEAKAQLVEQKLTDAFRTLDTFRDCACKVEKRCAMHVTMMGEEIAETVGGEA